MRNATPFAISISMAMRGKPCRPPLREKSKQHTEEAAHADMRKHGQKTLLSIIKTRPAAGEAHASERVCAPALVGEQEQRERIAVSLPYPEPESAPRLGVLRNSITQSKPEAMS